MWDSAEQQRAAFRHQIETGESPQYEKWLKSLYPKGYSWHHPIGSEGHFKITDYCAVMIDPKEHSLIHSGDKNYSPPKMFKKYLPDAFANLIAYHAFLSDNFKAVINNQGKLIMPKSKFDINKYWDIETWNKLIKEVKPLEAKWITE
jgi:hypothetical protein